MRPKRVSVPGSTNTDTLSARPQTWPADSRLGRIMEDQTGGPKDEVERKRASMTQTLIHWLADDDLHNLIILVALILLGIWVWLR